MKWFIGSMLTMFVCSCARKRRQFVARAVKRRGTDDDIGDDVDDDGGIDATV